MKRADRAQTLSDRWNVVGHEHDEFSQACEELLFRVIPYLSHEGLDLVERAVKEGEERNRGQAEVRRKFAETGRY